MIDHDKDSILKAIKHLRHAVLSIAQAKPMNKGEQWSDLNECTKLLQDADAALEAILDKGRAETLYR